MSARTVLDADMRTLGRWASQGWAWWVAELRALVPAGARRGARDRLPAFRLNGAALELAERTHPGRGVRRGTRAIVRVPSERCLIRSLERPLMSDHDLQRMIVFERETLLPFPPETSLVAGARLGPGDVGRMRIAVAGMPVQTARTIAAAAERLGIQPVQVRLDAPLPIGGIDFAPAMRAAGLTATTRSATPWAWGLVGLLFLLNVAVMIRRDADTVARLDQMVQAQQPALAVARTIERRAARHRTTRRHILAVRARRDALGALALVSRALPPGARVQHYVWDGETVRLTGEKPPRTDVTRALRGAGRFAAVQALGDEALPATPGGEPFDLTARIRR